MTKTQAQSAGNNAVQVLAAGDVNIGISEDRAREIAKAVAAETIAKFADEGVQLIQKRISHLDDRIIASLVREGRLDVFTDPGFQRSYKKAQEGAAVSEFESDYDLLTSLLIDRVKRGGIRTVRAGIERSIEIVDQIDDRALCGLTVMQAIQQYAPVASRLDDGLKTMDLLFSDLLETSLPEGADWLDHLDILTAVRADPANKLLPFHDFYPNQLSGYLAAGVPGDDFEWPFTQKQSDFGFPLIVPQELNPKNVRLSVPNAGTLINNFNVPKEIAESIIEQARDKLGFDKVDPGLVDPFFEHLHAHEHLTQIEQWWDQIPYAAHITSVGKVLARANADRLDVRGVLPPIE